MTDAEGLKTTYTYDTLGRVVAETRAGGGVRPDTTTTTTYDPEDRVLSRTVTAGDLSETETYVYDALGRTVSAIDSSGIETRYLYAIGTKGLIDTPLSHFFELMNARSSSRGRFGAGARCAGCRIDSGSAALMVCMK